MAGTDVPVRRGTWLLGSVTPRGSSAATVMGADQVAPRSVERITSMLALPEAPKKVNRSTSVPSGVTTIWLLIVWVLGVCPEITRAGFQVLLASVVVED